MTSENQKSWLHVIVGESYLLINLITLANLVTLNLKLKSTGAGRYQLLSVGGMPPQAAGLKDFSPKSQDAVALQQIKSVALYL